MSEKAKNIDYLMKKISRKNPDLVDILGVSISILFSREIFKKNQDINEFIQSVYSIEFLPYIMKSRTLIVARIAKEINNKDAEDLKRISLNIIEFLNKSNSQQATDNSKLTKKKDANDKMKSWLEGL